MFASARALGMTPSAVSQHITRLETIRGVKLFKRSTRQLSPTEAGDALAQSCRKLLQALMDVKTMLDNVKTEVAGEVRIALPLILAGADVFQAA